MTLHVRCLVVILVISMLGVMVPVVGADPFQQADVTPLLLASRLDLESLANEKLGDGMRPPGWTSAYDDTAPDFAINIRLDLELLVGALLGAEQRPAGWFGAVSGSALTIARDVRHDLELLADTVLAYDIRPALWVGADPIMRCSRETQALVVWLVRTTATYELPAAQAGVNYCDSLELHANLVVDILLPPEQPAGELREDLNTLAQSLFGVEVFPDGWLDGKEQASIRQDLELLRATTVNRGELVPAELWFGEAVVGDEWLVARGNRHDLELLADAKLAERPAGWTSFDALVRCPYTVQNAVTLLENEAALLFTTDPTSPLYCTQIAIEAAEYVEGGGGIPVVAVEAIPVGEVASGPAGQGGGGPLVVSAGGISGTTVTPYAYLDPKADIQIGQIVRGTPFTALARSSAEDSRMMYVAGEGFNVWVGWPWTTVTEIEYMSLPLVEDVRWQLPKLLCYATFCNTLVRNGDPLTGPTADLTFEGGLAQLPSGNLQYIGTDFVHILFNEHHKGLSAADFRLEICMDKEFWNTCQTVQRLYIEGELLQPLRVENGMPVWRLRYGHDGTARMESAQFYAEQIWIPRN